MAGTLTATIPSVIVFLFFQRALVRGIASSTEDQKTFDLTR